MPKRASSVGDMSASEQSAKSRSPLKRSNTGSLSPQGSSARLMRETTIDLDDLQGFARKMKASMDIRDRVYHFTSYPNCFIGSKAAHWMLAQGQVTTLRAAEYIGNLLMDEGYLKHACDENQRFRAGHLFYRFTEKVEKTQDHDLEAPGLQFLEDGKMPRSTAIACATRFANHINLADKKLLLKTYENCFSGREGVAAMIRGCIVNTVDEAVCVGNELLRQGLLVQVNGSEPIFENFSHLLFRLAPAVAEDEGVASAGKKGTNGKTEPIVDIRKMSAEDILISLPAKDLLELLSGTEKHDIELLVRSMRNGIEVRDRNGFRRAYPRCFLGKDAVSWLVSSYRVSTTHEAVLVGRLLLKLGHLSHVTKDQGFENADYLYRFKADEEGGISQEEKDQLNQKLSALSDNDLRRLSGYMRGALDIRDRQIKLRKYEQCFSGAEAIEWLMGHGIADSVDEAVGIGTLLVSRGFAMSATGDYSEMRDDAVFYRFTEKIAPAETGASRRVRRDAIALCAKLRQEVELATKMHNLREHKECFLGTDAVAWLVKANLADSADDACQMGSMLMDLGLVRHIGHTQRFKNEKLYYEFTKKEDDDSGDEGSIEAETSFAAAQTPTRGEVEMRERQARVQELVARMQDPAQGLNIKDHWYRLRRFPKCFVAAEAVQWMLYNRIAEDAEAAVALGNAIIDEGRMAHVRNEQRFGNNFLYFHFLEKPEDKGKTVKGE
ncbi:unnamed protein product [Chrysoparadoxa australica]